MQRLRWAVTVGLLATLVAVPARAQDAEPPAEDVQRFLVQVDVPAEPEPTLPPGGVAEQRADIADAQAEVESSLEGGAVVRDFTTIPFTVVEATPSEVDRLRDEGLVTTAVPDVELHTMLDESREMIGAPEVWPHGDGTGQTIAVLDTGTRIDHTFFTGRIVSQACFADDAAFTETPGGDCPNGQATQTAPTMSAPDPSTPCTADNCNHGTHVAGIALGDDPGDTYTGIAPGASLMSVRVFHDLPGTSPSKASAWLTDILAGLQFAYTNRTAVNPDLAVVNLSVGAGLFSGTCDSFDGGATRAAVANLTSAGIAVVAASGNEQQPTQIAFPSCVTDVISVGSVTTPKWGSGADQVSVFSNASPSLDLLAPGQPITSADTATASATKVMQGTSMATPHVAGAIALLRDARAGDLPPPAQRVRWLHGILDATGVCVTDPGNRIVYRRIQVDAADAYQGPPSAFFDDVPSCVWYEDAVNWLIDAGIAEGFADNTFRGMQDITRAQVARMVWRLFGEPDTAHENTYTDSAPWIDDALDWVSDPAGPATPDPLMAGYGDGTFRPANPITRGEVTRLLYRAAGSPDVTGLPQPFSDVPRWLDDAVRWIADDPDDGGPLEPIATGYGNGTYRQQNPITRAAVARMLQRFDAAVDT